MKVVGPGIPGLRIGLACLGALTPVVIFWAGRRGLGRPEGVVAGLVAAIYGPLVFTDGLLEKEGLAALVAAFARGAAAPAARGPRRPRLVWMAVTGSAWGMLALLRANALAIGPVGTIWAGLVGRGASPPRRRAWAALCFAAGFAGPIAPDDRHQRGGGATRGIPRDHLAVRGQLLRRQRPGGDRDLLGARLRRGQPGLRGRRLRGRGDPPSGEAAHAGAGLALLAPGGTSPLVRGPRRVAPIAGEEGRPPAPRLRDPRQPGRRVREDRRGAPPRLGRAELRLARAPGGARPRAQRTHAVLVAPRRLDARGLRDDRPVLRRRSLSNPLGAGA